MARNARGSAKELGQSFAWRHREVFRPFVHHLTDPKVGGGTILSFTAY